MFEIWEITDDGHEIYPFILIKKFKIFTDAYIEFQKLITTTPCCIICSKETKE
jgi:hypothetical protein